MQNTLEVNREPNVTLFIKPQEGPLINSFEERYPANNMSCPIGMKGIVEHLLSRGSIDYLLFFASIKFSVGRMTSNFNHSHELDTVIFEFEDTDLYGIFTDYFNSHEQDRDNFLKLVGSEDILTAIDQYVSLVSSDLDSHVGLDTEQYKEFLRRIDVYFSSNPLVVKSIFKNHFFTIAFEHEKRHAMISKIHSKPKLDLNSLSSLSGEISHASQLQVAYIRLAYKDDLENNIDILTPINYEYIASHANKIENPDLRRRFLYRTYLGGLEEIANVTLGLVVEMASMSNERKDSLIKSIPLQYVLTLGMFPNSNFLKRLNALDSYTLETLEPILTEMIILMNEESFEIFIESNPSLKTLKNW